MLLYIAYMDPVGNCINKKQPVAMEHMKITNLTSITCIWPTKENDEKKSLKI